MSESTERRQTERQLAGGTGVIKIGREELPCRVIDVSENGAQVRIEGRRASRNFVGKRAVLVRDEARGGSRGGPLDVRVVWARPAVNGVYLGLEILGQESKPDARVAND